MKKVFLQFNKAFTLAEVLITLVIIGVVAALAISPLVNTYVESSTVAKVKKGLSILGQAKKLAEVQNGSIEGWDFQEGKSAEASSQLFGYLKPHISLAKDCGSNSGCYDITENIRYLNGDEISGSNPNSKPENYKFVLGDGSVMWFATLEGKCTAVRNKLTQVCAAVGYDVNGDKQPNTLGKDVFYYAINIDGVYPLDNGGCSKSGQSGWSCSTYIIKHGNMKYLH